MARSRSPLIDHDMPRFLYKIASDASDDAPISISDVQAATRMSAEYGLFEVLQISRSVCGHAEMVPAMMSTKLEARSLALDMIIGFISMPADRSCFVHTED